MKPVLGVDMIHLHVDFSDSAHSSLDTVTRTCGKRRPAQLPLAYYIPPLLLVIVQICCSFDALPMPAQALLVHVPSTERARRGRRARFHERR